MRKMQQASMMDLDILRSPTSVLPHWPAEQKYSSSRTQDAQMGPSLLDLDNALGESRDDNTGKFFLLFIGCLGRVGLLMWRVHFCFILRLRFNSGLAKFFSLCHFCQCCQPLRLGPFFSCCGLDVDLSFSLFFHSHLVRPAVHILSYANSALTGMFFRNTGFNCAFRRSKTTYAAVFFYSSSLCHVQYFALSKLSGRNEKYTRTPNHYPIWEKCLMNYVIFTHPVVLC
ncbi:hypothetical protein BX661DRAFT_56822 [Kickxella alabastrina]|uniref:uncharacterized protein n=1 Tax=Kickxella alabastrina TaxID=61397 RepID=UPI00221FC352|nr:uncharacterized protein BX661DRAFT_56822 [Kickxella alabastrina]KAI7823083.1 hypothetical protein BX661DRAFT_56822 [Kickxella alabastrina]